MITFDKETKSFSDLTKTGAWSYSEDISTDVICSCWGIGSEPIQEWWPDKYDVSTMPLDLKEAIEAGHTVEAHNVAFERSIWANVMVPKYGWRLPPDASWRDLMATACYLALPAQLDRLSQVLGYGPKNKFHQQFITKYCKLHLKTAKTEIPEHDFVKIVAECVDDVKREQSISDELGDLPERELKVFLLSQKINMRGIPLDRDGIAVAAKVVDERAGELIEEFRGITGLNPTQRDAVMGWCAKRQVVLENMQADYLEDLLDGDLPQGEVRRALEIRRSVNKASTKKLDAMARQCGSDGRARFQTRYHGAVTGRETGSGFQPLNLHRGDDRQAPDQLVRDIMYGDPAYLDAVYGDATEAVARASRHWIMARMGKRIIAGDYSSIEAVVLACLAGEQWKIDAFRDGVKIYEHMADKIHGFPAGTVTKATHPSERQDGKTGELAFGYQGALGAWLKFDSSGRHSDDRIIEICKAWRAEHPAIVRFWRNLENAALSAVRTPGKVYVLDPEHNFVSITFEMQDEWLTMILPNGKRLWYRDPQLRQTMPQWHQPETKEDCAAGTCRCEPRIALSYMAQKTGQWKRVFTYGGKLAENATQATCREILVDAAERVEEAGYPIILTVYDEIVCEVEALWVAGSKPHLKKLMEDVPEWAAGWPISVNCWEGDRYRK